MGALSMVLGAAIDRRQQQDQQKQQQLRDFYYSRINDANTDPSVREQLTQDYLKLLSPDAKKHAKQGLDKLNNLRGMLRGPQQAQQLQGRPDQQPQAGSQPAQPAQPQARYPGQPLQTPATPQPFQFFKNYGQGAIAQAAAVAKAQADEKIREQSIEYDLWLQRGKDLGLGGRDLAEYAGSNGANLPTQQKRVIDKNVARDGHEGLWDHTVESNGDETWAKRPDPAANKKTGYIRQGQSVSRQDAIALIAQGAKFPDADGKDIDVEKLPPDMGLQAMIEDNKLFYVPVTPTQKTVTVGNEVYAVTPWESKNIATGGGTPLGQARTGSTGTTQQLAVNPVTGQITTNTLAHTTTPATPGARQAQPAGSPPTPAPRTGGSAAPTGPPQPGNNIQGVPLNAARQAAQIGVPLTEVSTQLFGDPRQPDLKPLSSFAELAGKKESAERIGKAIELTMSGFGDSIGNASIGAGAGPVQISSGGFGQWVQNQLGVPGAVASQTAKTLKATMDAMTPEERQAYNATMSMMSVMSGLRSITRSSAAMGSLRLIENELPKIGVNVSDAKQFNDQMRRVASALYNAVSTPGLFPGGAGISPEVVQRIKAMASPQASPKGKLNAPNAQPKTADDYLNSIKQ